MTNTEYLIKQAKSCIELYEPLPIDLVMKMAAAGLDVPTIEHQLIEEREANNG